MSPGFDGYTDRSWSNIRLPDNSVIMPLHTKAKDKPPETMLQWSPNYVTYLGLNISDEVQNTFPLNYTPLLNKTKEDCK